MSPGAAVPLPAVALQPDHKQSTSSYRESGIVARAHSSITGLELFLNVLFLFYQNLNKTKMSA